MTRPFSSIPDGHGTVTLYRHVERGDPIVVAVRRDTPADPAHLAAPPALDPDVYDLLAAVADPGEQVVERVARALEVHQLEWISHELGWDCGCNERGDLPAMLSILDGLRHQADAVLDLLRRAEPQPDSEQVEAVYYLLGERHPSLPIAELRETARELVRRGVVVRDEH